ncbi:MAG TPA: HEAT repeat domain-containing protein [Gemmatimonadales bacterium]
MHGISLLLAVATTVQGTPSSPSPLARARIDAELARASAAIAAAAPQLAVLASGYHLAQIEAAVPALLQAQIALAESWDQDDPADSLYRAGRRALNRNDYRTAVGLFHQVHEQHPRSTYAPAALYYEAYALYRIGGDEELRTARDRLRAHAERFPRAATQRDAAVLLRRVQGALAQRGDAEAAEDVEEAVRAVAPPQDVQPPQRAQPPRGTPPRRRSECNDDDDDDLRLAALNAMLQMDADRALPILKTVLEKRDEGSTCLRRKAIFLVSQKRAAETEDILLDAARRDPDSEVRLQAVFWLSQVGTEKSAIALDSILQNSTDPELQEKAIFALSQHRSARAAQALRGYAERRDVPQHIREQAIFWLSQHHSADNAAFLKALFPKLENDELKEKVLFAMSQMRGDENDRWLLDVALDRSQNMEIRKKALFWAGQSRRVPIADLVALYNGTDDREMREQLVFVYSQRREPQAVDKLLEIAKTDTDRELRKKALFWLGQSRDPRVAQLLLEIINQNEP